MVVTLIFMPCLSCLGDIPKLSFYFIESLVVGLRFGSCVFVMLLPLEPKPFPRLTVCWNNLFEETNYDESLNDNLTCLQTFLSLEEEKKRKIKPAKIYKNHVFSEFLFRV